MVSIRKDQARALRSDVAGLAAGKSQPEHRSNADERAAYCYAMNFTKGLPHDPGTGLVQENAFYELFVKAIDSGNENDFVATPLGPPEGRFFTGEGPVRAWESQSAGLAFDLQGPDAQAVTMPPAPSLGSPELTAEIAEVYAQALLRDALLSRFGAHDLSDARVDELAAVLNQLDWFKDQRLPGLSEAAKRRRRINLTPASLFRGIAPGDDIGPYLSQFLLIGNTGVDDQYDVEQGLIQYGAQTISQKVPKATPGRDYLTDWETWLDVQNGLDRRRQETYTGDTVFITTGRDLATFVHYDALYQAYLNACLILLARNIPFDPGIPFQPPDATDHQQGFAHFGAPHILSLVTEVATRCLKAVRYQKFNVHRRLRPEALAGRLEKADHLPTTAFTQLQNQLDDGLLERIQQHNNGPLLLPMAFPEGSPMHPSYGAGHATVAGACVTVLKAFFDHSQPFAAKDTPKKAFVVADDGAQLKQIDVTDTNGQPSQLTVEGELNKLAANISIGRNWAGVHYYTDYWESLLLGEQIAIQILQEQRHTFQENFSMTIPRFTGDATRI